MELFPLLVEDVEHAALDALGTPCRPLLQDLPHAHDAGLPCHEDVEVAADRILQGRQLKELRHQLIGIDAAL